jgi:hydrogenase/urease accessory protein HupE
MPTTFPFFLFPFPSGAAGLLAHLVQTGFGGFYDGMAHWAVTPEDVMLVLALALLAALGGKPRCRQLVLAFPAAWFLGGAACLLLPSLAPPAWTTFAGFGLVGLLVALDRKPPATVFVPLASVAGILHGAANGTAMRETDLGWLGLGGAVLSVFIVSSLLPALLARPRKPVARIFLRVAGSWLTAASMLMLGWMLRPG